MKLNLLPTYVSREKQIRNAVLLSLALAALGIGASAWMIKKSQDDLRAARARVVSLQPQAAEAVAISKNADVIVGQSAQLMSNIQLANAMLMHSDVYPNLYNDVKLYIPGFFRATSLNAASGGANATTVTMQGVIRTFQQYADMNLALLRMPGANTVSRQGYQIRDMFVPPLTREDQVGRPIRPGEPRLPDEPLDRLDVLIANARDDGFVGAGGFGTISEPPFTRGAMPDWSTVTFQINLNRDIQVPDPRGSILGGAGGG